MKRGLLAAILVAGAALAPGVFCPALASSVAGAGNVSVPAAQKSSVRPRPGVRLQGTSRRAAQHSLTPKRRRAIGEGAPLELEAPGRNADCGPAGNGIAPAVLRQLRVVMRAIRNHDERASGGVSGARLHALALIDIRPGLQVGAFADELGIHQSTASNLLEQLARQGLVEKRRDGNDHRVVSLYATTRAKATLKSAPAVRDGVLQQALNRLSPSTLASLQSDLADLIRTISSGGTTRA